MSEETIETLRRERDEWQLAARVQKEQWQRDGERLAAAEARAERLTRALTAVRDGIVHGVQARLFQVNNDTSGEEALMLAADAAQATIGLVHTANAALSDAPAPVATPDARDAELVALRADRDGLVAALVRLSGWSDPSFIHAVMHVENAVRNLQADLATERTENDALRERVAALEAALRVTVDEEASGKGDAYSRLRYAAKVAGRALSGGTSALDAALAKAREEALDDVAARVGALVPCRVETTFGLAGATMEPDPDGYWLVRDNVFAAIDAARRGAK